MHIQYGMLRGTDKGFDQCDEINDEEQSMMNNRPYLLYSSVEEERMNHLVQTSSAT